MDYGGLIRQAWGITWRHRFLWVPGALAGGALGMPSLNRGTGCRVDPGDLPLTDPSRIAA